ncbi:MAG: hypothetical protein RIC38_02510 [Chromatocurvus sp.]
MSMEPKDFNEPGRQTLVDADIAGVADGLLMLTRELWVVSDRLEIMEAVLRERGIDISEDMERFQPDQALQSRLDEKGERLVRSVLNAIAGVDTAAPDSTD